MQGSLAGGSSSNEGGLSWAKKKTTHYAVHGATYSPGGPGLTLYTMACAILRLTVNLFDCVSYC
jgi:hypothetical protein